MNIEKILAAVSNPQLYEPGTAVMWTDEYISRHLLNMHTDLSSDIASRSEKSIDATIEWMRSELGHGNAKILDLGCGPGLYTQRLAAKGHDVTGVDFSEGSIAYAKETAQQENLDIGYICGNYLDADFGGGYDLIMMIYCDFGVLSAVDQQKLLHKVFGALRKGGMFIFDALNESAIDSLRFDKSWEFADKGFWQDAPYLCLSEKRHYPAQNAMLDQHVVIDESGSFKTYRFWNHYFDEEEVAARFVKMGFDRVERFANIVGGGGAYNDEGVTFFKAVK